MEDKLVPQALKAKYGKSIPYDSYLPTCQDKVERRTCKVCYKYHATIKSLDAHKRLCKRSKSNKPAAKKSKSVVNNNLVVDLVDEIDTEDLVISEDESEQDVNVTTNDPDETDDGLEMEVESLRIKYCVSFPGDGVETILNLREWLKSPWQADIV